jgi:MFS family permease
VPATPAPGGRRFARGVGATARVVARGAVGGGRRTGRWFVRSTRAEGAGESGLASLIDLHAVQSASDALLTVALANTLFFAVDAHEARSRVALYLVVTMAPFAVIAPVIGPLLDRFRHGRRYALAATFGARAFLAWVMAGAVDTKGAFALYPAAFGALVCSKAYGVSRSAVVPRVLPPSVTLVRGNARLTLWGTLAATIAAPIGQGLTWATGSPSWTLRLATVGYLTGAVFSFRLPQRVDSNVGETRLRRRRADDEPDDDAAQPDGTPDDGTRRTAEYPRDAVPPDAEYPTQVHHIDRDGDAHGQPRPRRSLARRILPPLHGVGPRMAPMLRANTGLRAFSGFLTLFLAFLIRTHPLGVFSTNVDLAVIVACAALGNVLGTTIGAWLRSRRAEPLAIMSLSAAAAIGIVTAIWFNLLTAALAILIANLSGAIGKLGLDSVIQRDAKDSVRTSAFARSETALQLSWVLGGFLAIVLPSNGSLGLALASVVLVAVLVVSVRSIRNSPARGIEMLRQRRALRGEIR